MSFSHPMIESTRRIRWPDGIRLMLKVPWFIDVPDDTRDFHLHEIGASETGGARLDGVYESLENALARVQEAPPRPVKLEEVKEPLAVQVKPAIAAEPPKAVGLLGEGIERLGLSSRASSRLSFKGFRTIGDLVLATEADLMAIHKFGQGCLDEVKSGLAGLGLALRQPQRKRPKP